MKSTSAMIKTAFLRALIAICGDSCAQAKSEKLAELITMYADYGGFNGTVLVAEKEKVIYKKGFGLANVDCPGS